MGGFFLLSTTGILPDPAGVIPLGKGLAADVQGFAHREAKAGKIFGRKALAHLYRFNLKARGFQTRGVIVSVNAYVVVLPKAALAFCGVGNAGIFVGSFLGGHKWNLEDSPSAGFHDPMQFTEALSVVGDVFQDMVAKDDVEPIVFQGDLVQVEVEVGQGRFDVAGEDGQIFLAFEPPVEALFGGDVQQVLGPFEEVGKTVEVDPQQAVAFQGVGARSQGVFADLVSIAVRQKRAVRSSVDGVGKAFTCPNQGSDPLEHVTQSDQPGTGDVAEGPADHTKRGSCLGSPKAS